MAKVGTRQLWRLPALAGNRRSKPGSTSSISGTGAAVLAAITAAGSGGGTTLATLTVTNNSGSNKPANSITRMAGVEFAEGAVPAGTYPRLELTDGTPVPFSIGGISSHPTDGSMNRASILLRIPQAINAGASVSVRMKNGGTAPSSSALGTSTISSAADLKIETAGANASNANLSTAAWVSSLNQGITDGHVDLFMDGPVGRVYRVMQEFNDGSADHPQLAAFHYVQVLQNESSGLYGLRWLPTFQNGWWATSGAQAHATNPNANRYLTSISLKNGATSLKTYTPTDAPFTFTWSGSGAVFNTSSAAFMELARGGVSVVLSSSGTLPTGLAANTIYWARYVSATSFSLHTLQKGVEYGDSDFATATGSGSGTHTATIVAEVGTRHGGPYLANDDSHYHFVAAGGTGTEAGFDVFVPNTYRVAVESMPPVDTTVTVDAVPSRSFIFDKYQDLEVIERTSGDRPDIGILTGYCYRDFIRGNADFKTIRVHALQQAHKRINTRQKSTRLILNTGNTSYTGLGTPTTNFFLGYNSVGDINSNMPFDRHSRFSFANYGPGGYPEDMSHNPQQQAYAYMISGEPQFLDIMLDGVANNLGGTSTNDRDRTVGATTYYNQIIGTDQFRTVAWTIRDLAWAAMLTPDTHYGADLKGYVKGSIADNLAWLSAHKAATWTTFARDNGFVEHNNDIVGHFQVNYWTLAACLLYQAVRTPEAKAVVEDFMKWWNGYRTGMGMYYLGSAYAIFKTTPGGLTGWKDVMPWNGFATTTLSWNSSTNRFTAAHEANAGLIANGDTLRIDDSSSWNLPAGLSGDTTYYVVNLVGDGSAGSTFQVSLTEGGAPVSLSATGSIGDAYLVGGWHAGASTTTMASQGIAGLAAANTAKSVPLGLRANMRWAKALGCTIPSGYESAIETYMGTVGTITHASDPNYALLDHF